MLALTKIYYANYNGELKTISAPGVKYTWNIYTVVPYYVWNQYTTSYQYYFDSTENGYDFYTSNSFFSLPITFTAQSELYIHIGSRPRLTRTNEHIFGNDGGFEILLSEWTLTNRISMSGEQAGNNYTWYLTSMNGVSSGKIYFIPIDHVTTYEGLTYASDYWVSDDSLESTYGPTVGRYYVNNTYYQLSAVNNDWLRYYNSWTLRPLSLIGQVTDPQTNKYPNDGANGSYWYTKQSGTIDGRGDFVQTVESEDPNAYPESGVHDGDWYEKQSG